MLLRRDHRHRPWCVVAWSRLALRERDEWDHFTTRSVESRLSGELCDGQFQLGHTKDDLGQARELKIKELVGIRAIKGGRVRTRSAGRRRQRKRTRERKVAL